VRSTSLKQTQTTADSAASSFEHLSDQHGSHHKNLSSTRSIGADGAQIRSNRRHLTDLGTYVIPDFAAYQGRHCNCPAVPGLFTHLRAPSGTDFRFYLDVRVRSPRSPHAHAYRAEWKYPTALDPSFLSQSDATDRVCSLIASLECCFSRIPTPSRLMTKRRQRCECEHVSQNVKQCVRDMWIHWIRSS
jgi:hypothetical protein